ncbi:ankyrin repeat domain-containing protein [Candidatus Babeliales bacterium]|nr:ankyrin repeat domain-containing protein [Candidatus Babeliales bacterium]
MNKKIVSSLFMALALTSTAMPAAAILQEIRTQEKKRNWKNDLHSALITGNFNNFQRLIQPLYGSPFDPLYSPDNSQRLILAAHCPIASDGLEITRYLLENTTLDVNAQEERTGDTALHIATRKQNIAIAALLIKHNADLTIKNSCGDMPVDIAQTMELTILLAP